MTAFRHIKRSLPLSSPRSLLCLWAAGSVASVGRGRGEVEWLRGLQKGATSTPGLERGGGP